MDTFVQLATILSPIIAVLIAWWTVRNSSRDTAKKIAAIEESTKKQIERLRELSRLQLQITTIQLNKELWDANKNYQINNEQVEDLDGRYASMYVNAYGHDALERKKEKNKEFVMKRDFYSEQQRVLKSFLSQLDNIKNQLEG